jgi:hypothetical protein
MKLKNWIFSAMALAVLASCNNEASTDADNRDTTAVTDKTTTTTTVQVPAATRTSFETRYPTATNVTWRSYDPTVVPIDWEWTGWTSMDPTDYVVVFNDNGSEYWAWYDENGEWVGTVTTISDHSSLPAAVNNTIKSKYSGYTILSVDKENDKNRTAYEIDLDKNGEKMTVLIDENGSVLKSKGADGKMKEPDTK